MSDIFISYDRADREKIKPVATALAAQGWVVSGTEVSLSLPLLPKF